MNYADRSDIIEGNLRNGPLTYTFYPANDITRSRHLIAINSVIFDSQTNLSATCKITCNFITTRKRNHLGDTIVEEQTLNVFHLKTSSALSRGIFRFCNSDLL